jgi:hypothetical protein
MLQIGSWVFLVIDTEQRQYYLRLLCHWAYVLR